MPTLKIDLASLPSTALIDAHQAAQALGLATKTLANWRCSKRTLIPFVTVGSRIRYRVSDLLRYIETHRQEG